MAMKAADYLAQLQALLPQGAAWSREPDANLTKVLQALSVELANIDGRADILIQESDPRTTNELLTDWECAFGLPEACSVHADTLAERRAVLHTKVTMIGGQSRAYFIDLASRLDFEITITEFNPFVAGGLAGDVITNAPWTHWWQVNAPEENITVFTAGGGVAGDPLRDWGNELLECAINRLKPAHTDVIFAYGV